MSTAPATTNTALAPATTNTAPAPATTNSGKIFYWLHTSEALKLQIMVLSKIFCQMILANVM